MYLKRMGAMFRSLIATLCAVLLLPGESDRIPGAPIAGARLRTRNPGYKDPARATRFPRCADRPLSRSVACPDPRGIYVSS